MPNNPTQYFITGIGTDVGKTVASAIVVKALQADYWKPIQAGDLEYSDTHKVKAMVNDETIHYHKNAYALKTPMSPHAAAEIDGLQININQITRPKTSQPLVIEGAGGILVPLNSKNTIADLITKDDKIILVSRHYLGSINHSLLSLECLKKRGFENIGIIFSGNEHPTTEDIILSKTSAKCIGRINEEQEFTPQIIARYAKTFRENLLNL
ncbi:dethiobiotin synthase [Mesohalobacter halotolerans]|uniref:ATP-dependent dethiobiotin synthetase BioD n=1 Tax=Mesohalobacter halotolerans TaxID=1883405 RepID=A0A4V6AP71_9FLAO|nr:dethiobiotin synthase [Mesohalobacter halotolerans]TKS57545.1 dethiobiotin synthase [Mesohalobacter halotolerans]